jgi:NhaP-type Na+/H+ or K+/H+ antiporter
MTVDPSPSPAANGSSVVPEDPFSSLIEVSSFAIAAVISVLLVGLLLVYALRFFRVQYASVPDSWIFLLIGATTAIILDFGSFNGGSLEKVVAAIDESFSDIFFTVLLPPVVFQAGFELNVIEVFRSSAAILTFAFLGTLISAAVIGLLLWGISQIPIFVSFTAVQAFLLGTLLSATDTINVIAIFNNLKVSDDLFGLVFGESIFNDAVAIVLFRELSSFEASGVVTAGEVFKGVGLFILNFFGSTAIGILVGVLNTLLFRYVRLDGTDHQPSHVDGSQLQKTLLILVPYVSYMVSDAFHLSGVVAILFTGVVTGMFTIKNVSVSSRRFVGHFFRILAHICEALSFCYIGIALPLLGSKAMSSNGGWQLAFLLIVLCLGARAVSTYVCTKIVNYTRPASKKVSNEARFVIWLCGLRGGVAFALATAASKVITNPAVAAVVPPVTLFVVLFTMVTVSPSMPRVIKKFGLGGDEMTTSATTGTPALASGSLSDDDDSFPGATRRATTAGGDDSSRGLRDASAPSSQPSSAAQSPGRADPDRFKRARELLMNVSPPPVFPQSQGQTQQNASASTPSGAGLNHAPSLSSFSSEPRITARVGLLGEADRDIDSNELLASREKKQKQQQGWRRGGGSNFSRRSSSLNSVELREALGGDPAVDRPTSAQDLADGGFAGDGDVGSSGSSDIEMTAQRRRRVSSSGASLPDTSSNINVVAGSANSVASVSSGSGSAAVGGEIRRTASAAGRDKLVSLLLRGNSNGNGHNDTPSTVSSSSASTAADKALLPTSNSNRSTTIDVGSGVLFPAAPTSSGTSPAATTIIDKNKESSGSGTPPVLTAATATPAPTSSAPPSTGAPAAVGPLPPPPPGVAIASTKIKMPALPRFPSVNFGSKNTSGASNSSNIDSSTTAKPRAGSGSSGGGGDVGTSGGQPSTTSSFGLLFKQAGEKFAAAANQALTRNNSNKRDSLTVSLAGSSSSSLGAGGGLPPAFTTYPSVSESSAASTSAGGKAGKNAAVASEAAVVDRLFGGAGGVNAKGVNSDDDDDEEEFSITFGLPPAAPQLPAGGGGRWKSIDHLIITSTNEPTEE